MKNGESEFRVVDRRGSVEADAATKSAGAKSDHTVNAVKELSSEHSHEPTEQDQQQRPVDFASFIVGLATQAMILLGEMPEPNSGKMLSRNPVAARQTIDIIAMLQEKTKGNLSSEESKLLQDVLTSLRMTYVQSAQN